jgi:RND family efflux transporter MFP subunit
MTHISPTKPQPLDQGLQGAPAAPPRRALGRAAALAGVAAVIGLGLVWFAQQPQAMPQAAPPPPRVTVSRPLQQTVAVSTSFLGQFSAADTVELRAQVGGILTSIDFTDGQIVHKGDLLFTIDPWPYQVRLQQAVAQLQTSLSHRTLTGVELWRARELKRADYGTAESVDQRAADEASAQASISSARAAVEDAELDLEYARITAPFTGRIGAHLVSVGNLVSGSRGGVSPTTLLARLVSLDPIYLDFDMSEADYIAFQKAHPGPETADVVISLDGDGSFSRHGRLDFVDNSVNRDTGTIHVRATVPNKDLVLTPGEFARLRLPIGAPANVLLLPAAAIVPDQSQNIAMVVGDNGKVAPRIVQLGELYRGLRIVKSGLDPNDRVIIDGLMMARPGSTVSTMDGKIVPQGS